MSVLLSSTITAIGPEVPDLLEGGVLILFADGCPPELAEVSVSHRVSHVTGNTPPKAGDLIRIGSLQTRITAVGPLAWDKAKEMGHVVFNFGGANEADRLGEICAAPVDHEKLLVLLKSGETIVIESA